MCIRPRPRPANGIFPRAHLQSLIYFLFYLMRKSESFFYDLSVPALILRVVRFSGVTPSPPSRQSRVFFPAWLLPADDYKSRMCILV